MYDTLRVLAKNRISRRTRSPDVFTTSNASAARTLTPIARSVSVEEDIVSARARALLASRMSNVKVKLVR